MSHAGGLTKEEWFHRSVFLRELFGNRQDAFFSFLQRVDEALQYFTLGISAKRHFNLVVTTRTYRELSFGPETRVGSGACTVHDPLRVNMPALALDVRATERVYVLVPASVDRNACTGVMAGPVILRTMGHPQRGSSHPWPTDALQRLDGRDGWLPLRLETGQRLQLIGQGVPMYDVLLKQKEAPDVHASSARTSPPTSVVWEIRIHPADQDLRHPVMAPDPSFHLELHYQLARKPPEQYWPTPRSPPSSPHGFHPKEASASYEHHLAVPTSNAPNPRRAAVFAPQEYSGNPFYG